MKVLQVRKEHICSFIHCCLINKTIKEGSIAVAKLFKKKGGWYTAYYHPECYIQSIGYFIEHGVGVCQGKIEASKLRRKKRNKGGKVGRPPKTNDPTRYRALKSALYYHRRLGHDGRVQEIKTQMVEMVEALDR